MICDGQLLYHGSYIGIGRIDLSKGNAGKDFCQGFYLAKDLILGKVANDQTNETITAYLSGAYGAMDDERAIAFAVSQLRPERLTDQLCFRTEKSLANLTLVEVLRYDV